MEFFDPHEPWDPPGGFWKNTCPMRTAPSFIEPPYDTVPLSDDIKKRLRANYAGAVSCVDYWIGCLLETVEQFGLLENSVVVFMADHGAMLGEHGQFLKGPDKLRGQVTHDPAAHSLAWKSLRGKEGAGIRPTARRDAHRVGSPGVETACARNGQ